MRDPANSARRRRSQAQHLGARAYNRRSKPLPHCLHPLHSPRSERPLTMDIRQTLPEIPRDSAAVVVPFIELLEDEERVAVDVSNEDEDGYAAVLHA